MNLNPTCPVCGSTSFAVIGTKSLDRAETHAASPYVAPRLWVLFELWLPDHEVVVLTYKACQKCGFVFYTPRPGEEDIKAKYAHFASYRIGAHSGGDSAIAPTCRGDVKRSRKLYSDVRRLFPNGSPLRVLDFGGGDGRLMSDLVSAGHQCFLLDYSVDVVAGVTKLGDTLENLDNSEGFDLIVCSQVIEHLADPLGVLAALRNHLRTGGVLFVDVPMEIWGRPPIHAEPVTHVNFFTPASLSRLLIEAGFQVSSCRLFSYPAPDGDEWLGIKAIARQPHAAHSSKVPTNGLQQTRALLSPTFAERCWRFVAAPKQLVPAILARLGLHPLRHRDGTTRLR